MESINIMDGLILTIVSILVVFVVLATIWGLVEIVSSLINQQEPVEESVGTQPSASQPQTVSPLAPNKTHQQVAELMALVLASEDASNKKFEIVESKRIK